MHIPRRQQLGAARFQPMVARIGLTLRAVPVATRVIGEDAFSALRAFVDMPAQRGGAAAQNRIQHFQMLPVETKPGAVEICRPGGADEVGHLQWRSAHGAAMPSARYGARAHRAGWRSPAGGDAKGAGRPWSPSGRYGP